MPCSLAPVRLLALGQYSAGVLSHLTCHYQEDLDDVPFEAPSHGLRSCCLRFAGALAGSPTKGFRSVDNRLPRFLLSQASPGAQRQAPTPAPSACPAGTGALEPVDKV